MKPAALVRIDADRALQEYVGDGDWMPKTGIGGMLTAACWLVAFLDLQHLLMLPVSLAIGALLCGYLLRNLRTRIKKPSARLPDWNDFPDLFMSGITWIMIQFCMCVLLSMVVGSTLIVGYYALISPHANTVLVTETTFLSLALIFFWAHFLMTYLWVNFAVEERLTGGIAVRKVIRLIRANPGAFWLAWALSLSAQVVAVILPAVTLIGIFIVPSTLFAAQLLSTNLLAQAWRSVDEQND